jgi:hypothetical protein
MSRDQFLIIQVSPPTLFPRRIRAAPPAPGPLVRRVAENSAPDTRVPFEALPRDVLSPHRSPGHFRGCPSDKREPGTTRLASSPPLSPCRGCRRQSCWSWALWITRHHSGFNSIYSLRCSGPDRLPVRLTARSYEPLCLSASGSLIRVRPFTIPHDSGDRSSCQGD